MLNMRRVSWLLNSRPFLILFILSTYSKAGSVPFVNDR